MIYGTGSYISNRPCLVKGKTKSVAKIQIKYDEEARGFPKYAAKRCYLSAPPGCVSCFGFVPQQFVSDVHHPSGSLCGFLKVPPMECCCPTDSL
jgi:hypothetical protein